MNNIVKKIVDQEIKKIIGEKIIPVLKTGYKVLVKYKTPNGEKKFKGIVIGIEKKNINTAVFVLSPSQDTSIRMTQKFLLYSPFVEFTITEKPKKTLRAKRFDLINKFGKKIRLK